MKYDCNYIQRLSLALLLQSFYEKLSLGCMGVCPYFSVCVCVCVCVWFVLLKTPVAINIFLVFVYTCYAWAVSLKAIQYKTVCFSNIEKNVILAGHVERKGVSGDSSVCLIGPCGWSTSSSTLGSSSFAGRSWLSFLFVGSFLCRRRPLHRIFVVQGPLWCAKLQKCQPPGSKWKWCTNH